MPVHGLEALFARWSEDRDFRERFRVSPQRAIEGEGIELTVDEWDKLNAMELTGLTDHHLKHRVSRSGLAMGKLLGVAGGAPSLDGGVDTAIPGSMRGSLAAAGLAGGSLSDRAGRDASEPVESNTTPSSGGAEELSGPSLDELLDAEEA